MQNFAVSSYEYESHWIFFCVQRLLWDPRLKWAWDVVNWTPGSDWTWDAAPTGLGTLLIGLEVQIGLWDGY